MFQLNYQSHKSVYEQIVDNIKEQIMTGVLKENTQLPTVRELSQLLTINPHIVQKAFQTLDQEGYIYTIARQSNLMKVVLPLPFIPTTASRPPTLNFMFRWRRAYCALPG